MKNALVALAVSFALGFTVSSVAAPAPRSEAPKCKAAGQSCDSAEDCCSRMCRKDTKKCS